MIEISEPSFTRRISSEQLTSLRIEYLFYGGDIQEDRAGTIVEELEPAGTTRLCRVEVLDDALCRVHGLDLTVNLYETSDLVALARSVHGVVAVDLTSLEHRIWAPLIRELLPENCDLIAIYAEPNDYRKSDDLPGSIYDLSTSRGIEPLPGFARLTQGNTAHEYFAPLLGFEGARLGHILDQEDVDVIRTTPIIGSPGFRLEYPTYAFLANRDILSLNGMGHRVEYARASCPFEAYRAIERIHGRSGSSGLRVAPIGTKPHALGAVLYAIRHPDDVELIYDNPIRSSGRSTGSRGVYVYEVGRFVEWAN